MPAEAEILPLAQLASPIRRPAIELTGFARAGLAMLVMLLYVFLLLPIVVVVSSSFSPTRSDSYAWSQASLRWYYEFFAAPNFTSALWFSLWLAAVTTVVA